MNAEGRLMADNKRESKIIRFDGKKKVEPVKPMSQRERNALAYRLKPSKADFGNDKQKV